MIRCGQCGRAFVGTSAKGRSRLYHYYTCSTRYRYGTRNCGANRLPKDELEEAVLEQMIEVYRNSHLIADALTQLQTSEREEWDSIDVRVAALRQDQAGVRRSIDRNFAAFEHGTMKPATCQERLDNLQVRLDALINEEQGLLTQEKADRPPTPELVAEPRRRPLQRHGSTEKGSDPQAGEELRVMGRGEIIPMYRVPALVRAPGSQVELPAFEPG